MVEQAGYRLTKAQLHRAERYRAAGIPWRVIAASLGVGEPTIRRELQPGYQEMRRETWRRQRQRVDYSSPAGELHASQNRLPPAVIAKVIATVPADTRSFTARLFGDPLPGRSALDHVKHQSGFQSRPPRYSP